MRTIKALGTRLTGKIKWWTTGILGKPKGECYTKVEDIIRSFVQSPYATKASSEHVETHSEGIFWGTSFKGQTSKDEFSKGRIFKGRTFKGRIFKGKVFKGRINSFRGLKIRGILARELERIHKERLRAWHIQEGTGQQTKNTMVEPAEQSTSWQWIPSLQIT